MRHPHHHLRSFQRVHKSWEKSQNKGFKAREIPEKRLNAAGHRSPELSWSPDRRDQGWRGGDQGFKTLVFLSGIVPRREASHDHHLYLEDTGSYLFIYIYIYIFKKKTFFYFFYFFKIILSNLIISHFDVVQSLDLIHLFVLIS